MPNEKKKIFGGGGGLLRDNKCYRESEQFTAMKTPR
jgi:hypothetical protein